MRDWNWKLGKSCSGNVRVSGTEKQKEHEKQLSSGFISVLFLFSEGNHAG